MNILRFKKRAYKKPVAGVFVRGRDNKSHTFLDLRQKVKERVPIIEIHFEEIMPFMYDNKRPLSIIVIALLVVSSFSIFGRSYASIATFYPSTCLGGWQHPENAQGPPSLDRNAPLEKYSIENSALLANSSAEIYCGTFAGDIPKDTLPKKFILSFDWSVDDGTVKHEEPKIFDSPIFNGGTENQAVPLESSTGTVPTNSPATGTQAPTLDESTSTTETKGSADTSKSSPPPVPPTDASAIIVTPPSSPNASSEPQSFLNSLSPAKAFAQEAPNASVSDTHSTSPTNEVQTSSVTPGEANAFGTVMYTLDGATWNTLGTISMTDWRQAHFEIPLAGWNDLSKLQISFTPIQIIDRNPVVYLDAMQIRVDYEEGKIFQKPTVVIKNDAAQMLDGKSDFTSDEAPQFAVVDSNLSTNDIAMLVKEKKAEIVLDTDGVLRDDSQKSAPASPPPADTSAAKTLYEEVKNLISSPSPAVTEDQSKKADTSTTTDTNVPPSTPDVLEGPPPAVDALSSDKVFSAPPTINTPADSAPSSFFVPKKNEKNGGGLFSFLTPLVAKAADDVTGRAPKITGARVLDYFGNPTTIKTKIQTVTINGETRDGVSVEKREREFRAGRYTLEVTVETANAIIISEQDFTWGVLAINTEKSMYTEGDTAYLQMGILDDKGYSLCDAKLALVVKSPSGATKEFTTEDGTIEHSKKCGRNNVVEVPDYYAHYEVPFESGRYTMTLTATTDNGIRTVIDAFDVDHPDFDVSRTAPTRIFPFTAYDYPMTMRIVSKYDWSGVVTETLPSNFIVSQPKKAQKYESIKTNESISTITWNVDLKAGEETTIGYLFKGPEISPEFFLLGPLKFFDAGADPDTATPVFQETRQWQIADDATCTGSTTGNWNTGGNWTGCSGAGGIPGTGDNITINSGVTMTMNVNSPVLGTITVTGALNTSGSNYSLSGTTLSIGSAGTLTANASVITLSGTSGTLFTLTGGGTFTQGTSEVAITSASGTPTLLSGAPSFHKLTINAAATVINAGAAITMSSADAANKLYIQKGVLNDAGYQIAGTSNGTLVVNSAAALCIGGTATSTNATCDSGATPTTATTFPTNYTNGNITMTAGSTTSGWYNSSWLYRTKITIDHTKVANTDQSNFPVLVSLTNANWKTIANSGHMGNAGATDLLFTSSDGTTKLNHEIEFYVATTGQVIAWVKVPTLTTATDTDLYMYYDNVGVAAQANATGTWNSNYKQVLHVSDGTTLSVADSTNTYNGTNTSSTATTGKIDGGAAQTGGAFIANGATIYTMIGGSASHTISFWENMTSFSGGDQYAWDFDTALGLGAFMNIALDNQIQWGYTSSYRTYSAVSPAMTAGTWHYVVAQKTAAGSNAKLYVDGTLQTGTGSGGTIGDPTNTGSSGGQWGRYHTSTTLAMDGSYDEMHILNTATSADWITTEYNNQSSPSTFIPTVATEEAATIADAIVYYNADAATTISSTPTYRNLYLQPQLTAARTYTFASGSTTVNGNLTITPSRGSAALLTVNMGGDITVGTTKTTTISRASSATSTLVTTASNYNLSTGFINIATGGTLDASSSTSTITLTGITGTLFTLVGTYTPGTTSTLAVTSASGSPTLFSASTTVHILKINSAATVINQGATLVTDNNSGNNLWINSGVFNQEGRTITAGTAGTLQIDSGGTLCLGGTTTATNATCDSGATQTSAQAMPSFTTYTFDSASTVIYLSDANTTISQTPTYGNLTFKPKALSAWTYTLGGAMTINGNFDINPGTAANLLTVNAGGTITVASGKTTTIERTTSATSSLVLRVGSTNYNLSTGLLNIATGGTLTGVNSSYTGTITLTGTSGTIFTTVGTFTSGNSNVKFTGDGAITMFSGAFSGYDLELAPAMTASRIYTGGAAVTATDNVTIDPSGGSSYALTYNSGGTHTITGQLKINPAASTTANMDTTSGSHYNITTGTIDLEAGATLTANSSTITANGTTGTIFTNNTGTFTAGTSLVKITGDAAITLFSGTLTGSSAFYDLEFVPALGASRTYTGGAAVSATDNFTLDPTGGSSRVLTYNLGGAHIVTGITKLQPAASTSATVDTTAGSHYNITTGSLDLEANGTLTAQASTITLTGTSGTLFTNSGTFTAGTSTVNVTSASGTPTLLSASTTFYIIEISAAATVINQGATIVTNNTSGNKLWINSGVFNQESRTITAGTAGTLQIDSGGTLCLGGTTAATNATCDSGATQTSAQAMPSFTTYTFNASSTVIYLSDAATTVSNTPTYGNLTLKPKQLSTRIYTLGGAMTINGNFDINPGTAANALTVNAGGTITVASTKTTTIERTTSATSSLVLRVGSTNYDFSTGLLNIATGGKLDCVNTSYTGTITLTGISGTLFTLGGTFTEGDSTVTVTSASGTPTLLSASTTFYILNINSAATVINQGSTIVTDNTSGNKLYIQSGVLNQESRTITAGTNGTLQIDSGGTLCLGGTTAGTNATCDSGATQTSAQSLPSFTTYTFNASSTVIFLSDAATTVSNTPTYGNLKFQPVLTSADKIYTLGGAMTINGNWDINPNDGGAGRTLTVNSAGTMTVAAGKTTTITRQGSNALSSLVLSPSSGNNYALSTGLLNVATGGTLDGNTNTATSTISLTATSGTLFTLGGTFNAGNTTVQATGNGSSTLNSAATTFYALTLNSTGTKTLGGNITVDPAATLTVTLGTLDTSSGSNYQISAGKISIANSASAILTVNASAITVSGTSGTLLTRGASGVFNGGTSTVTLSGNGSATVNSGTFTSGNLFYDLTSSGTGTKTLGADITSSDIFAVTGGTFDTSSSNYALTVKALTISASKTLVANASAITNTGNWTNNGTFTAGTSTVTMNGGTTTTINGTTTFYNLTITHTTDKEVDFTASGGTPTYTVSHTFTVTGTSGHPMKLRSVTGGTKWDLLPSGTASVNYADVSDGGCHAGAISISPSNFTDSGNNDACWLTVLPTLTFSLSSNTISLGTLTTSGTGSGTHTISVATNTGPFTLTYLGTTLTHSNGTNTIAGYSALSSSVAGTEGFGITLADTAPTVNSGSCTQATNYATSSKYTFIPSTTTAITNESAAADCIFTATYKANISSTTAAGSYSTAITYIASGTF